MLLAAARALSERSPARENPNAPLLPSLRELREVALEIALAVAMEGQRSGLAPRMTKEEVHDRILEAHWAPVYPVYA